MEDFKITRARAYRVNFRYRGKHYSIQDHEDGYEEYTDITCKEDKDFCVTICLCAQAGSYIPSKKHGLTYKDMDLSRIKELIAKYIDK